MLLKLPLCLIYFASQSDNSFRAIITQPVVDTLLLSLAVKYPYEKTRVN